MLFGAINYIFLVYIFKYTGEFPGTHVLSRVVILCYDEVWVKFIFTRYVFILIIH